MINVVNKLDNNNNNSIIAASIKLPKQKKNKKIEFTFRPITSEGVEKFKSRLLDVDWSTIERENASESALALNVVLQRLHQDCFPEKTKKIRSNDTPWCDDRVRRLSKKKARIYKNEGKSARYRLARDAVSYTHLTLPTNREV